LKIVCAQCREKIAIPEGRPRGLYRCGRCGLDTQIEVDGRGVAQLKIVHGHELGETYIFTDRISIGRGPDNDLTIPDVAVSRRHVQIFLRDGSFTIKDLDSLHGTFVHKEKVTERSLRARDEIQLGSTVLEFLCLDTNYSPVLEEASQEPVSGPHKHPPKILDLPFDKNIAFAPPPTCDEIGPFRSSVRTLARAWVACSALHPLLNVNDAIDKVLELALSIRPADRAFLLLRDEGSGRIVPRVSRHKDRGTSTGRFEAPVGVVDRVVTTHASLLVHGLHDPTSTDSSPLRSMMLVPIIRDAGFMGVLAIDAQSNQAQNLFTLDDLKSLTALGRLAAAAINNSLQAAQAARQTRRRTCLSLAFSPKEADRLSQEDLAQELAVRSKFVTTATWEAVDLDELVEHSVAEAVAALWNDWLEVVIQTILERSGTICERGRRIAGVWGATDDDANHAHSAVLCALTVQSQLEALSHRWKESAIRAPTIVGWVHTHRAIVGVIGSPEESPYLCLAASDPPFRLRADQVSSGRILLSEATYLALEDRISARKFAVINRKPGQAPIPVYLLAGAASSITGDDRRSRPRISVAVPLLCRIRPGEEVHAVVVDISEKGAGLILDLPSCRGLEPGQEIEIALGATSYKGTVRSVRSQADQAGYPISRVGIELSETIEHLSERLNDLTQVPG